MRGEKKGDGRPNTGLAEMRRRIEQLEASEAELKRKEEALRQSEEKYRLVVENAREVIAVAQDGRIKFANPKMIEITGYSQEDLSTRPFVDLIHPDDREMVLERHQKRMKGEWVPPTYSFRIVDRDGNTKWVEINAVCITWEGRPATLNFLTETTERKRAEDALIQARDLLQALIQSSPLAITVWDPDEKIWMWNPAAEDMFGWKEEEVRGLCRPIIPERQEDEFRAYLHRALWGDVFSGVELQALKKDGTFIETNFASAPLHDGTGNIIGAMGIFSDISNRVRTEKALRDSEEKYRLLADSMSDVIWTMDLDLRVTYVSPSIKNLVGFSVEEAMTRTIPEILASESVETGLKAFKEGLDNLRQKGRLDPVSLVLELMCVDGSTKWTESIITFLQDAEGRPVGIQGATRDISKRKRAEDSLRQSEEKYRLLVENQNELIVKMDPEGRLLYTSPSYCRVVGKPEEELLGNSFIPLVHPEDQPVTVQAIGNLSRSPYSVYVEIRSVTVEGFKWLAWSHKSVLDENQNVVGIVGVGRDITDRKMAEEALWESEARYRAVVEQSPDGIFLLNIDTKCIVEANSAFKKMLGYSSEEIEGLSVYDYVAADKADVDEKVQNLVAAEGPASFERQYRRKDGSLVDVWVNTNVITYRGKKLICILVRDLTEKKAFESQRLRAQRIESIGQLAGGIAHDLNNILAPIVINTELLRMRSSDESSQRLLSSIASCAQRGADFVSQILSFSRGMEGERHIVPAKHVLKEMEQMANETFPKFIRIESEIPEDLWSVLADPTQLHQVLLNLCLNAKDAMPEGGKLFLSGENLFIDELYAKMHGEPQTKPGPYVSFSVSDSGIGIPPEIREKIFDPFFTTKERGRGTGLGLATAQAIVRGHGGFFSVYSEVGKGTTIRVYLPASPSDRERGAGEEAAVLPLGNGELILFVDDEAPIRESARALLETHGYRVQLAADGAEAVSVFAQHRGEVQAVITDMAMPVMDGLAALKALRKMDPEVKVIVTSGLDQDQALSQPGGSNVKAFLRKPFTARRLLMTLQEAIKK